MDSSEIKENPTSNLLAQLFALSAASIGFIALLGWILDLPLLASFGSGLIPMAPSTAILFVLLGGALFFRNRFPQNRGTYLASIFIGSIVAAASLLLFFFSIAGKYSSFEHIGLSITGSLDGLPIGHMSPIVAICFVVSAMSFLLTLSPPVKRSTRAVAALVLACLVVLTASLHLIAYLFGSPLMHGGRIISPALPSSLTFFILALDLIVTAGLQIWPYSRIKDSATAHVSLVLLLIFVLLAAGFVTGGYFAFRNYEKNYRQEVEHELSAIAELKVNQLVQYRAERLGDASILFKNPSFASLVRRFFKKSNNNNAQRQLQGWLGKYKSHYQYHQVFLLDTFGVTRMSIPKTQEPIASAILHRASETLTAREPAIQDFYRNENDQKIYLSVQVPIFDEQHRNRPIGVVVLTIDPASYLYPLIQYWPKPNRTSETLIIRRDGNDALFLNELRFQKNTALTLRSPLTNVNMPAVKAVLGEEGIVEGLDYRSVPVLACVRRIPRSPWFLVARMDISELYAPVTERLWQTVLFIGVLLFGTGAGVGFAWRHLRAHFYREKFQASETLRASEEKYRRLVEFLPDGIVVHSEGRIVYANPSSAKIVGAESPEKLLGAPVLDFVHPDYRETATKRIKQSLREGSTAPITEEQFIRVDGTSIAVEVLAVPIFYGDKPAMLTVFNDITGSKRAEAEIKRKTEDLLLLNTLNTAANRGESLLSIVQLLAHESKSIFSCSGATVYLLSEDKKYLVMQNLSLPQSSIERIEKLIGTKIPAARIALKEEGMYRQVLLEGKPKLTNDPEIIQGMMAEFAESEVFKKLFPVIFSFLEIGSVITVPIMAGDGLIGIVDISRKVPFTESDLSRMQMIAEELSAIIQRKRAEIRLRETQEKIERIYDSSPNAILVIDLDGKISDCNQTTVDVHRYATKEELIGTSGFNLVVESERQRAMELLQELLSRGTMHGVELTMLRRDGSRFVAETAGSVLHGSSGKPIGLVVITTDITERKRAEEKLRESEDRFRDLVQNSRDLICTHDLNGRILSVNPFAEQTLGYDHSALLQMNLSDILAPEVRPGLAVYLRRITHNGIDQGLMTVQTKSGELRIWEYNNTLRTASVSVPIVRGMARDVTDREHSLELLRKSEEKYRALIDHMNDGILVVDNNDAIQFVNKKLCTMVGYSEEELIGSIGYKMILTEDKWKLIQEKHRERQQNISDHYELELKKKSGEGLWVSVSASPVYGSKSEVIGSMAIISDISARKLAEEVNRRATEEIEKAHAELVELNMHLTKAREEERAVISREIHDELGQSLTALTIDLSWVREHAAEKLTIRKKLDGMLDILDGTVRNVQRIASELRPSILDDLGLTSAIEWYCDEFEVRSGITCQVYLEEIQLGDLHKSLTMFRILQETLTNVIRHAGAQMVKVNLHRCGEDVCLEIKDDGIGISKEKLNDRHSLGLIGMRERTKLLNGRFEIFSPGGKGTTVRISFPICP